MKANFCLTEKKLNTKYDFKSTEMKATFLVQKLVDISGLDYATNERVDGIVNDFTESLDFLANRVDNTYNKQEVDVMFESTASISEIARIDNQLDVINETIIDNKDELTQAIGNVAEDVANTYTKQEVDDKLSHITVDAYTKEETDNLLSGKQDAGDYATNNDLHNLDTLKADKSDTYTKQEVDEKVSHVTVDAYTKQQTDTLLSTKADKSEIPTIPTNISYFNNDSGYVDNTYHDATKQDIITDLDTYVKNTDYANGSIGGVVKTSGTYAITTSSNGYLQAQVKTKDQYDSLSTASFVGKGTLENVKEQLVTSVGDTKYSTLEQYNYLDEKVREIELFKFPNAVIIGEPNISNGQVSGFSTSNYLQFPFILDLHNKAFQIDFAFTTGDNITTQQNILDSQFGLALAIQNGKGVMAISGNGTSWNIGSSTGTIPIQPNTTYYARLSWNGMQYRTLLSTNGIDYTQDMYLVGVQAPYPRTMYIGGCTTSETGHTPHPFLGTINMNKAFLTVNGQVIWQGMDDAGLATRADISLSNLDEIGQAKFDEKQNVIEDLDTIKSNASDGATAYTTIQGYGNIVTHSISEFVKTTGDETINGVKTFIGGTGGNSVSIWATNGMSIGSYDKTSWVQFGVHRACDGKTNTGSFFVNSDGSLLFRHKTSTNTTSEGSANDAMFTLHPVNGLKVGWSGTAGVGTTADKDVLVDTITYSKLNTTTKDVLGAINELKSRLDGILDGDGVSY